MAEKEVYHVKLHQSVWERFTGYFWVIALLAFWWVIIQPLKSSLNKPEAPAYSHDLRGEGAPVEMDFDNPWSVKVTVSRPDGDEIRFYDVKTGRLEGSFLVPASAEAPSSDEESGAE